MENKNTSANERGSEGPQTYRPKCLKSTIK